MAMILQKAVPPQLSTAYLESGMDRVSGFVVPAADVASITDNHDLYELHGLSFPGSPFSPDKPIDILHVPTEPTWRLIPATGGTDEASRAKNNGNVLDRKPFDGSGFTSVAGVRAPLSWLEHDRLSSGARLWRFHPDRLEPELIGSYDGPALGWCNHLNGDLYSTAPPSKLVGWTVRRDDGLFSADVTIEDDSATRIVLVSAQKEHEELGFVLNEAGMWVKEISPDDAGELATLHASAQWRGMPVRVCDDRIDKNQVRKVRIASLARDANVAERLGLSKMDAGVYEKIVDHDELDNIVYAQRVPTQWASDEQITKSKERREANRANASSSPIPARGKVRLTSPPTEDDSPAGKSAESVNTIVQGLINMAPADWESGNVVALMLGTKGELMAGFTTKSGDKVGVSSLEKDVVEAIGKLRQETATPDDKGAWLTAVITVKRTGEVSVRTDHTNEPRWRKQPEQKHYVTELKRFPRAVENIPDWFLAQLPGGDPTQL